MDKDKLKEQERLKAIERQSHEDALKKLKKYMVDNDMTQHELAHFLGTTEANVSRWFTKRHIMGKAWQQLIDFKMKE